MSSVVTACHWRRESWLALLWRLAILALPWQTRWFSEIVVAGAISWEWSKTSFYLSWLCVLMVIGLGWPSPSVVRHAMQRWGVCLLTWSVVSIVTSVQPRVSVQWWMEVWLLILFVWTLRHHVQREELLVWVMLSILPHAILGLYQVFKQEVFASTWLGIAAQVPVTRGVAVIETIQGRWLRAYGGFPHPNIFAGWLVLGLIIAEILAVQAQIWLKRTLCLLICAVYAGLLVLTFSRSAWLAAVTVQAFGLFWLVHKRRWQFLFGLSLMMLVSVGSITIWQRNRLVVRFQAETRLERLSLDDRAIALKLAMTNMISVWPNLDGFPWQPFGSGPRAYASAQKPWLPHVIPVLFLLEFGLGGLIFCLMIWRCCRRLYSENNWRIFVFTVPVLLIGLFDHYLLSTWAGLTLLCLAILIVSVPARSLDR